MVFIYLFGIWCSFTGVFTDISPEVWEGYWNGVHVAIKKLKSMVNDELFQERFLREVESLRRVFFISTICYYLTLNVEKEIIKMLLCFLVFA